MKPFQPARWLSWSALFLLICGVLFLLLTILYHIGIAGAAGPFRRSCTDSYSGALIAVRIFYVESLLLIDCGVIGWRRRGKRRHASGCIVRGVLMIAATLLGAWINHLFRNPFRPVSFLAGTAAVLPYLIFAVLLARQDRWTNSRISG